MTPEQAKLKQREDARIRSRQAPRRASSQAVSSDQSEVTEEAPAVYRVPQITVPEDLQGVARLIQTELAKIEQSQTILLSLWEKIEGKIPSDLLHVGDFGVGINQGSVPFGVVSQFAAYSGDTDEVPGNGAGWQSAYGSNRRAQLFMRTDPSLWIRFSLSDSVTDTETEWIKLATFSEVQKSVDSIRGKIYAELLALNPGIVVPVKE